MLPKRICQFTLLLFLGMLLLSCTGKTPGEQPVAKVGNETITFEQFLVDFTFFPQFRPNSTLRSARLEHLQHMIDRILLRRAAEEDGLENLPEIQEHLNYILHRESLKYLYQKEVLDKIPVSDKEAWEEYKRENIQVRLRHLYAPTREIAQRYYQRLQDGETFQQLAREAFTDTSLARNGGDLGFLSIKDLDPVLADSVYNLRIGVVSHPLKSSYGYHVVRVEDVRRAVFLSRREFELNKNQYVNEVKRRRANAKSAEFLSAVLKGKSITIKKRVLNQLLGISQNTLQAQPQEAPLPKAPLTDLQIDRLQNASREILSATLVEFGSERWSVADFLKRVRTAPPLNRPALNDQQRLVQQIIDMVRDEFLLREAYRRGYQNSKEVRTAVQEWRKDLLANEFKKRITWAIYKENDEKTWKRRKNLYRQLKENTPVKIFEEILFHDVEQKELLEKQVPIKSVIRDYYIW